MAELLVDHPRVPRRAFQLESETTTIGRDAGCDVTLESAFVSRTHLRIEREGDTYYVIDPGSRNGAFLNGRRLPVGRRERLEHGDEIGVADFLLTFLDAEIESTLEWTGRLPEVLHLDIGARQVWFGLRRLEIHLTTQEFELLELLYARKGEVVPHDEIGERIWGSEDVGGRRVPRYDLNMIHQLVSRLRRKLRPEPGGPSLISSVPRVGYRLDDRLPA